MDDFVTLNLEKLDKYVHIRGTGLEELEGEWRGSEDEDMGSDSEDDDDGESSSEDGEDGMVELDEHEDDDEETKAKRHAALSQAERVGESYEWDSMLTRVGCIATLCR